MIFDLVKDFSAALAAMPADHPKCRILRLLEDAIRRDLHFIARHARDYPQALFQCIWNNGWWYDCDEAVQHYIEPEGGWKEENAPWLQPDDRKLCRLLEQWRSSKEWASSGLVWLRARRPPPMNLGTGQEAVLYEHLDKVTRVAVSANGRYVAGASVDSTVLVWDVQTLQTICSLRGHEGPVLGVAFAPDGQQIATGSGDHTVRIWDARNGQEVRRFCGHEGTVRSVAYSPDGQHIVSASSDRTLRIWDSQSGRQLQCIRGHHHYVNSATYSPDGQRIASGSVDTTVRIWDADTGNELHLLHGHSDDVTSVAFSPDGTHVASACGGLEADDSVQIWDVLSGERVFRYQQRRSVDDVSYSPDGSKIVTGSEDNSAWIWDLGTHALVGRLVGHSDLVVSVAFFPDSQRIVSGSHDGTVRMWNPKTPFGIIPRRDHEHSVRCMAYSPDGRRIITGSGDYWRGSVYGDVAARVWDVETGVEVYQLHGEENQYVTGVAYSPDGRSVAVASRSGARIYDTKDGQQECCVDQEIADVSGEPRCARDEEVGEAWSIAFSPLGDRIAVGYGDGTIRVRNAKSRTELQHLVGHREKVLSIAYSPDGRQIASGSVDGTVRIWDVERGEEISRLPGRECSVLQVDYCPDGDRVVALFQDRIMRTWDIRTREVVAEFATVGDVKAIAAGAEHFPLLAVNGAFETAVEAGNAGRILAWFPVGLYPLIAHPSGTAWAGADANHLYIITLEGGSQNVREADTRQTCEDRVIRSTLWFYSRDRKTREGPVVASELRRLILTGKLKTDDLVSADGKRWSRAKNLRGVSWQQTQSEPPPTSES